jgi:sugar phosphate isomerase/epimerase
MKVGVADYGMSVWYGDLYDLESRLKDLKSIGYDGIERLDRAESEADAIHKAAVFRKLGMDFATCRGGNVQTNIKWTAALGKKYIWITLASGLSKELDLFCRQAADFAKACADWNLKAVLHNHLWQTCEQPEDLEYFLDNCPGASLLLDTGHLAAAGGDCMRIIDKYFDRIASVHVKDYILENSGLPLEDRARGRFCELGAGNVDNLDNAAIVKKLVEKGYDGWIFVEHDRHLRDPLKDLAVSREYLRKAGI